MVLPVTVLVMAALIALLLSFYSSLAEQTRRCAEKRKDMYQKKETEVIRLHDRLLDAGKEVSSQ